MHKGFVIVTVVILLCSVWASAQTPSVDFVLSSRETMVGVPVYGQLTIENANEYEQPTLPEVEGLTMKMAPFPNTSSYMQNINGQITRKKTVSFACDITPTRAGEFTIPSFDIIVDGKKCSTSPITLAVNKSESNEALLFVEISGNVKQAYVGQEMTLTLKIFIKPFYSTRYRRQLSATEMARMIDFERSSWGIFEETLRDPKMTPRVAEVLRKDSDGNSRSYYLYEFERKYDTSKPGKLTGDDINIIVYYPVSISPVRGVFGEQWQVERKPISATATVNDIEILPVPEKGRPETYNGAVGDYEITSQALPVEASVGDPITLTLIVGGTGRLNELPAPDLQKIPELVKDFKVPREPLAGVVRDGVKTFTTSIRPLSEKVTKIPAIPLTFFDPNSAKFMTVSSQPIPITVKPVEKFTMRNVVTANGNEKHHVDKLTETNVGIYANETDMGRLLIDNGSYMTQVALLVLAGGPALVLLGLLVKLYSRMLGGEKSRRRRNAGRAARGVLSSAKTADDVEAAILQFMADRVGRPVAGMTRGDAVAEMKKRNWPQDLMNSADELMSECERARYSAGGAAVLDELKKQAQNCLKEMERQK